MSAGESWRRRFRTVLSLTSLHCREATRSGAILVLVLAFAAWVASEVSELDVPAASRARLAVEHALDAAGLLLDLSALAAAGLWSRQRERSRHFAGASAIDDRDWALGRTLGILALAGALALPFSLTIGVAHALRFGDASGALLELRARVLGSLRDDRPAEPILLQSRPDRVELHFDAAAFARDTSGRRLVEGRFHPQVRAPLEHIVTRSSLPIAIEALTIDGKALDRRVYVIERGRAVAFAFPVSLPAEEREIVLRVSHGVPGFRLGFGVDDLVVFGRPRPTWLDVMLAMLGLALRAATLAALVGLAMDRWSPFSALLVGILLLFLRSVPDAADALDFLPVPAAKTLVRVIRLAFPVLPDPGPATLIGRGLGDGWSPIGIPALRLSALLALIGGLTPRRGGVRR